MTNLQQTWAKRLFLGKSFAIAAPTGYGKTTFGLIYSLYLATKMEKSYVIVPAAYLVYNVVSRCKKYLDILQDITAIRNIRIVSYLSSMNKREASESLSLIKAQNFDIFVSTDRFLHKRLDILGQVKFNLIFIDDIESFLKSPKNAERILKMIGFTEDELTHAKKVHSEKKNSIRNLETMIVLSGSLTKWNSPGVKLFSLLLGFEPSYSPSLVRNVRNFYLRRFSEEQLANIVRTHGKGCLIFTPHALGRDFAIKLAEVLKYGLNVKAYEKPDTSMLDEFSSGKLDALIGIASTRGPLAKGIDLPEAVRYAVFAGVPRREISLEKDKTSVKLLLVVLKSILPLLEEVEIRQAKILFRELSAYGGLTKKESRVDALKEEAWELLKRICLKDGKKFHDIGVNLQIEQAEVERIKLVVPDVSGYIQASGRTSRLFANGLTRGVSIVLIDDEDSFKGLEKKLAVVADESFEEYDLTIVNEEFMVIDRDRSILKQMKHAEQEQAREIPFKTSLIVVESPAKARTIAGFFGKPSKRNNEGIIAYEIPSGERLLCITASQGHIFDLTTKRGFHGVEKEDGVFVPIYTDIKRCVSCKNQFTDSEICPICKSNNIISKIRIARGLGMLAFETNEVLIATDPDSEGEKIAYDILCSVYPFNKTVRRLEFHEVTKRAFLRSLHEQREIDIRKVEAQIVRRIEDRWIGFELSHKLWQKFGKNTLSTGRVQTPVLGWVVKRTDELKKKRKVLLVKLENGLLLRFWDAEITKSEPLEAVISSSDLITETISPPPPFTTDTLLSALSRMGMNVIRVMELAQDLFELGLITYHRTDSTRVSDSGLAVAKQYLEGKSLEFKERRYESKGAHECIRPTRPIDSSELFFYLQDRYPEGQKTRINKEHILLYDIIFRRFIASQMKEALVESHEYSVKLGTLETKLKRIIRIKEHGFLVFLPLLKQEPPIVPGHYRVVETKSMLVPSSSPYTQHEIISLMKERGIGRPSTYAKIIDTLFARKYIKQRGKAIIATKLGKEVYEYLESNFEKMISEETTRELEKRMDLVERGEKNYQDVLQYVYSEINDILKQSTSY
jgi:reverse gyrase